MKKVKIPASNREGDVEFDITFSIFMPKLGMILPVLCIFLSLLPLMRGQFRFLLSIFLERKIE